MMYKRNKNLLINTIMNSGRERNFESIVERKNIRRVIKLLRQGSIIWYGPDQDFGAKNSVFVLSVSQQLQLRLLTIHKSKYLIYESIS